MSSARQLLFGLIALVGLSPVLADEWQVVPEASSVAMYATKQGEWFDGVFREFTALIDFDPANPESGRIEGVVQTGSIDTQDAQNDDYVTGYLDVEHFSEARFVSAAITATVDGFRASGALTLKGITHDAAIDFTFTLSEASSSAPLSARFWGAMTINRFDYDIAPEVDTGFSGQDVEVRIDLMLTR